MTTIKNNSGSSFSEDVKKLLDKYQGADISDVLKAMNKQSRAEEHKRIIEKSHENDDLVGRCYKTWYEPSLFPGMYKYFKVLSIQSANEYRVECLEFDEHPVYFFDYRFHKVGLAGDYYLGGFDFESFVVVSEMAKQFCDESFIEITPEEFKSAMMRYTGELAKIPWSANHYRGASKRPGDDGWLVEEKADG